MAEQATSKIGACRDSVIAQVERQREVEQDVVVIAGIKRDAVERARGGSAAQDVAGAVPTERRDLYSAALIDCGKFKHRPVQADVSDGELGGVDADREPAGAGVDVIAGQRALVDEVELAVGI